MIVVDANIWISLLSEKEPQHRITRDWFAGISAAGEPIAVPMLFLSEVSGAVTRRTGSRENGRNALRHILAAPAIRIYSLDSAVGFEAARLAIDLALRGADAIYVALAGHFGIPLYTWDGEVIERARTLIDVRTPS